MGKKANQFLLKHEPVMTPCELEGEQMSLAMKYEGKIDAFMILDKQYFFGKLQSCALEFNHLSRPHLFSR